jgi:ATP-binding protein involved in chromosome partitioning
VAITREHVLQALSTVPVDASGTDLVASGRLSDVVVDDAGRVMFSITIEPSEATSMEWVRQAAVMAVQGLPTVKGVFASLTADRPAGSGALPPSAAAPQRPRAAAQPRNQRIPGVQQVIAVASGKGGVGKSTTACNLALGLKALGLKVGLLDADIYGPSMPKLLGIHGKPRLLENRILEPMPPGTGDAQLTMAQATPLAGAVIVSTPQDLALIDARRGVSMFKRVEIPILGIVENMATFICPHCGQSSHIFGHGGAREEAKRLEVPFLGEVPLDMTIRELSDAGRPVVVADPDGPHARIYKDMAQQVWTSLSGGAPARPAPRIVIE